MTTESVTTAARLTKVSSTADDDADDSDYGWAMFLAFVSSVLAITLAVCVLALAPSWWVLGVVYGTDLIVTSLVFKVVLDAFVSPAYPHLEAVERADETASPKAPAVSLKAARPTVAAHH